MDELSGILAYPPDVKERIYLDSFDRLLYTPTLTAKQIMTGKLKGLWARLGLYHVISEKMYIGQERGLSPGMNIILRFYLEIGASALVFFFALIGEGDFSNTYTY